MVSQHLPFVMGEVFNRPHLISEAHAAMIAAVLSGKMNITSLSGEFGSMDDRGMSDLAEMGRMEARTKRQQSATPHPGMVRYDGWGFRSEEQTTELQSLMRSS